MQTLLAGLAAASLAAAPLAHTKPHQTHHHARRAHRAMKPAIAQAAPLVGVTDDGKVIVQ